MILKKLAAGLLKNLIVLLIATMIFSSITLNFPSFMQNLFGDIYQYASPDAQKDAIGRLTEACSSFQSQEAVTLQELCTNATLMDSMKEDCKDYRELKSKGIPVENDAQVRESCSQIESGEIEKQCIQLSKRSALDFNSIGALCRDYNSGKINDRQFFYSVIGSALGSDEKPKTGLFDRYYKFIGYLNKNKLLYLFVLAVLIALLYLAINDLRLFYSAVLGISVSIGLLILLPYFGILVYEKLVGIDTTSILLGMFGFGIFDPKALISVILLMFLRTYNAFIITIGILFLSAGIIGKVYLRFFLGKNENKVNNEKISIPKEEKKKSKGKKE